MFSKIYKQAVDEITPNADLKASLLKTAAEYKKPKIIPLYKYAATAAAVVAVTVSIKAVPYITNVNNAETKSITIENNGIQPTETAVIPLQTESAEAVNEQTPDVQEVVPQGDTKKQVTGGSSVKKSVTPKTESVPATGLAEKAAGGNVKNVSEAAIVSDISVPEAMPAVSFGDENNAIAAADSPADMTGEIAAYSRMVQADDELNLEECAPKGFEAVMAENGQCNYVNGEAEIEVSVSECDDFVGDRVDLGNAEVWKNGETYTVARGELCVQITNSGASDEAVTELIQNITE